MILTRPAKIFIVSPKTQKVNNRLGEWSAEGGGIEPQWLIRPLTGLTGRVQYPLATPSKHKPAKQS
jgi:hypothetical protein